MSTRRLLSAIPLALAVAAPALGPPAASGATESIGTFMLSAPADATVGRPFRVGYEVTGSLDALYVYARHASADAACDPDIGQDGEGRLGTLLSGWGTGFPLRTPATGATEDAFKPSRPGVVLVCGYVLQAGDGAVQLRESLRVPVRTEAAPAKPSIVARRDGRSVRGTTVAAPADARVVLRVRGSSRALRRVSLRPQGSFVLGIPSGYVRRPLVVALVSRSGRTVASHSLTRPTRRFGTCVSRDEPSWAGRAWSTRPRRDAWCTGGAKG